MTNDDILIYISYLKSRIKRIEDKILKRINMTQEEKELNRLLKKLKNDPEFQNIFFILLFINIRD